MSSSSSATAAAAATSTYDVDDAMERKLLRNLAELGMNRVHNNKKMRNLLFERYGDNELPSKRPGRVVVSELLQISSDLLKMGVGRGKRSVARKCLSSPTSTTSETSAPPPIKRRAAQAQPPTPAPLPVRDLIASFSYAQLAELKQAMHQKEFALSLHATMEKLQQFSADTPGVFLEVSFCEEPLTQPEFESIAWKQSQPTLLAQYADFAVNDHRREWGWGEFEPTSRGDGDNTSFDAMHKLSTTISNVMRIHVRSWETKTAMALWHLPYDTSDDETDLMTVDEWVRLSCDFMQWRASHDLRMFLMKLPIPPTVKFACIRSSQFCPAPLKEKLPTKNIVRTVWNKTTGWSSL